MSNQVTWIQKDGQFKWTRHAGGRMLVCSTNQHTYSITPHEEGGYALFAMDSACIDRQWRFKTQKEAKHQAMKHWIMVFDSQEEVA